VANKVTDSITVSIAIKKHAERFVDSKANKEALKLFLSYQKSYLENVLRYEGRTTTSVEEIQTAGTDETTGSRRTYRLKMAG